MTAAALETARHDRPVRGNGYIFGALGETSCRISLGESGKDIKGEHPGLGIPASSPEVMHRKSGKARRGEIPRIFVLLADRGHRTLPLRLLAPIPSSVASISAYERDVTMFGRWRPHQARQ